MACVGSERHNVFAAFQKVNCPHTAKVVNKDGPVVERHKMRPHHITIDASEGFNAIVATLWAPEHCITCCGISPWWCPQSQCLQWRVRKCASSVQKVVFVILNVLRTCLVPFGIMKCQIFCYLVDPLWGSVGLFVLKIAIRPVVFCE